MSISFQPYKWECDDGESLNKREEPEEYKQDKYTTIYIHGLTEENKTVCVKISDFKPWVYLELPESVEWNNSRVEILANYIKNRLGANKFIKRKLEIKYKLYYMKEGKFLWMTFHNIHCIEQLQRIVSKPVTIYGLGTIKLVIHEHQRNASPILKLQAIKKLYPSGWLSVTGTSNEKFSTADIELECSYNDLTPIDKNVVTNPLILSMDLEAVSFDKTGMTFPDPTRKTDPVIVISGTVGRYFDSEFKNYALVNESGNRKVNLPNTLHFENEKELLLGWRSFINKINPDVIISYNGLSFDDNYLAERASVNSCWQGFSTMGRLIGKTSKRCERRWSSSAYGDQKFQYLDIPGRLHIDMFPVISKEFTNLNGYRLDDVSEYFLNERKIDLPAREMIKIYHEGGSKNMESIVKYCNQDTMLPFKLLKHLNSWISLIEMANVMRIQIFDLITRGQQVRVFTQLYCDIQDKNFIFQAKWDDYKPTDDDKEFIGATVQNPRVGLWKNVATFDFKSLYPSTIIAYNLCFSTFVPENETVDESLVHKIVVDSHQGCEHDITERKTKVARKICKTETFRFYKAEIRKGLIPNIIEKTLIAREKAKKEMKIIGKQMESDNNEKLKMMHTTFDKRQNGLKINANSMYGGFGSEFSDTPFYPAAACTTAMGRYKIQESIDFINKQYSDAQLVYGDSVTADTPILVRESNSIYVLTIEELGNLNQWIDYPGFIDGYDKQYSSPNVETWSSNGWSLIKKVIRHHTTKQIYRIVSDSGCVDVTEDHSLLLEDKTVIKPCELKIGDKLLTGFPERHKETIYYFSSDSSKIKCQQNYYSLNQNVIIDECNGNYTIESGYYSPSNAVKRIYNLGYVSDYVYDLETEDGSFQAGIGRIIVHNTDSAMFCFKSLKDYTAVFKRCHELEKAINKIFPPPMYLEFENLSQKFLLLKKKNYIKEVINEKGEITEVIKKGVVSKRRDNCELLRESYMKVVDMVMNEKHIWDIYRYLEVTIDNLLRGKVDLSKLIITKSVKDNYKATNLPHLAVANKMRERGKYVVSGTRVPYIFTVTEKYDEPQYKKAEDPDFYLESKKIEIDYLYYLDKQIANPIDELLEIRFGKENVIENLVKLLRKKVDIDVFDYFRVGFEIN